MELFIYAFAAVAAWKVYQGFKKVSHLNNAYPAKTSFKPKKTKKIKVGDSVFYTNK